jgi:hypothetical protein
MPYKENEGKAELGPPAVRANATEVNIQALPWALRHEKRQLFCQTWPPKRSSKIG